MSVLETDAILVWGANEVPNEVILRVNRYQWVNLDPEIVILTQ